MPTKPNWKEYEDLVCEAMRYENPDLAIERNVHKYGYSTKTQRQIDIAATRGMAGHEILIVVDCKQYSRKLDANDVGTFKTLIEDVRAHLGILVTEKGFSNAAQNLAETCRIKLEIKTLEGLQEYKITFDYCEECDPGEDHFPGVIQWTGFESLAGDEDKTNGTGHCDWCNSLHVRCQQCDSVTGIPEAMYEEAIECSGGCGTIFRIDLEYAGHGMNDFILTVKNNTE